jgi:hypothetical protein
MEIIRRNMLSERVTSRRNAERLKLGCWIKGRGSGQTLEA